MKKILIIYPHFPPSNLVGVHRTRLFAQHLPSFGWEPILLTVHENFYEEPLDYNLEKLLSVNLRVEKVNALKITSPRVIGDIGLRSFFHLYNRAKQIIRTENIEFLYISIASFYCALLGRWLNKTTGIKYGIDYQDPWVHDFPGSEKIFSRHWFSKKIATILEPIAVKNASLITGVAESYYTPVLNRNPHLKDIITGAMPMGGEIDDHKMAASLNSTPYLFAKKKNKIQLMYAGAMLPKAYELLKKIFEAISENIEVFNNIEFHFVGTGVTRNGDIINTIKPLAKDYDIWETIIFEYPKRVPYLDILIHLSNVDTIFILGSTEPHYTPSKVYQAVLSGKPIFAVLHKNSQANKVVTGSKAGMVLAFDGINDLDNISLNFVGAFLNFLKFYKTYSVKNVNNKMFEANSAYNVTSKLVELLDKCI